MHSYDYEVFLIRWKNAVHRIGIPRLLSLPVWEKKRLRDSNDLVQKTLLLEKIANDLHR